MDKNLHTIKDLPQSERPREKLISQGSSALSNAELIALLLGSGTSGKSAIGLANSILSLEKEGIGAFARYTPEEFSGVSGIGPAKASQLCAAIELGRRIASSPAVSKVLLNSPQRVADLYMEELRRLPYEVFRVLMLNVKNELIYCEDISVGDISSAQSNPREVFSSAIKRGAFSVILVHNHPSGDPTPSKTDIATTNQLVQAGKLLGIKVSDHVIFGDNSYVSLARDGMF